jgi:hypothetical protein
MSSGVRTDVLIKDTMGVICEILRPTLGLEAQVVLQGSQLDTPEVVSAVGVGLCMATIGPMPTCRPYGDIGRNDRIISNCIPSRLPVERYREFGDDEHGYIT